MDSAVNETAVSGPLRRRVVLAFGRKTLIAEQQSQLQVGAVIELDAFVDDYIDVYADGRLVARGRALVVDGKLAVRVQEALAGEA